MVISKRSMTAHRLSRFEGPKDIDYRSIADAAKRSLIVKCSSIESDRLVVCLAGLLQDKLPVDLLDDRGETPLHRALLVLRNHDAIRRLVHQGKASVTKKNRMGRSSLSIAVYAAVQRADHHSLPLDPDEQKAITQTINMLMRNGARVDEKDKTGKLAWSYATGDKCQWIRRLKDKHLIIGRSSTTSGDMESVRPPWPGPQLDACNAFDIALAEVFLQKKRERLDEVFNFAAPSAYEVMYNVSSRGVLSALDATRPSHLTADKARCRWIHVPSNNEQWVHDLMISMDIQDASMGGQRHEGSRLIDRYMLPQVRRYKHFHRKANRSQPEPRPRTDRLGSTDSAATLVLGPHDSAHTSEETRGKGGSKGNKVPSAPDFTTTEADAIVIFVSRATLVLCKPTYPLTPCQMPILGFERHRHRKFLTQAFYEVDYAMQLARRAREDEDTDSSIWENPKLPGPQRRSAKIDAESSDDENLSTDQDQTRFDPLFWRTITHGREQVKTGREALLLNGYLDSEQVKPVHCRRTLDQFSYYMLNSTEARDKSQVAYRWAKNLNVRAIKPKDRPIVMVDQLWLWAFHDGTVLTSSPSTWDGHESFNLSNVIMYELRENKDRGIIRSIEDLLHLILKTSVDFFRRKGPANFRFQESFQSSINNVSEQQGHLFKNFRRTTKKLHIGTLDPAERKKEIEFLFSLDDETELLVEIMDIQDELTIVKTILSQQLDVLEKFLRLYPKKAEEDVDEETRTPVSTSLGKSELTVLQNLVQLLKDQVAPPIEERTPLLAKPGPRVSFPRDVSPGNEYITPGDEQLQNAQFPKTPRPKGKEKENEPPKPTAPIKMNILQNRDLMYETIGIVENNLRIVADMLAYAEKVERSVCNLVSLRVRKLCTEVSD